MFIVGGNWPSVTLSARPSRFFSPRLLRLWPATGCPSLCVSAGTWVWHAYTVRYLNNDDGSDIRAVWNVEDGKLGRDDNNSFSPRGTVSFSNPNFIRDDEKQTCLLNAK